MDTKWNFINLSEITCNCTEETLLPLSENVYMSIVLRQRKAYMVYEGFFLDTSIISDNGVAHSVHVGQELKGLT